MAPVKQLMNCFAYFKRIHTIILYWAPVIGSYSYTFWFLLKAKFGLAITRASFGGITFRFRSCDMSAIDETLIRGEYAFIVPKIELLNEPLIVDVGMNVGDFSILAVAVNRLSRIVGIEADYHTAAIARDNAPNDRPHDSWMVHHRAAWSNNEQIFLEKSALSVSNKVSSSGTVPVQGLDLPTLWALLPDNNVNIMKIDIEGAEEVFLNSCPELLSRVQHLIIEIHPRACNEKAIRSLLARYFSHITDIEGRTSSKPLLYCHRE